MRSIVLALPELLGVLVAGFLLVALFSIVMWLFNHDAHAFGMMLGYFAYAGGLRRDCCTRLLATASSQIV